MVRDPSSSPSPVALLRQAAGALHFAGDNATAAYITQAVSDIERTNPGDCWMYAGQPQAADTPKEVDGNADLLQAELQHRFQNLVAITQSMVLQTLHDGADIAEARSALVTRLAALNAAIEVLLQRSWQPGSIRATLCDGFARHGGFGDRISCAGPDLSIGPNAVTAITLAMHELATNAIKYGALSVVNGSVRLFWKVIDADGQRRLWLQWCELDGPAVKPPTRQGFGTRLICSATARSLGGQAELQFTPEGVTWLLVAPLERLAE